MTEETVTPQEEQFAENVVAEMQQEPAEPEQQEPQETMVPLSALQKERRKRQEAEQRAAEREAQVKQPDPEEDLDRYESATREDLGKSQQQTVRMVEERLWIKEHREKYEHVNEYLPELLKQRPHLALAIDSAPNRYEEAWTLMNALTPKQQQQLKPAPQKNAPNSPTSIPKAAGVNQAVDVMSMTDQEFAEYRRQRKRR